MPDAVPLARPTTTPSDAAGPVPAITETLADPSENGRNGLQATLAQVALSRPEGMVPACERPPGPERSDHDGRAGIGEAALHW